MERKNRLARLGAALALVGMALVPLTTTVGADTNAASPFLLTVASGTSATTAPVCTSIPGPGAWVGALPGSSWISTGSDCTASLDPGTYNFTATFSLPSDLSGLQNLRLDGSVIVDDSVTIQLNGHTVFTGGSWTGATAFSATDSSWFVGGQNTLLFSVNNVAGPAGVDFAATVSANGAMTPTPTSTAGPSATPTPTSTPGPTATSTPVHEEDEDNDNDNDRGSHGACVSAAAHSAPRGPGHGAAVREAAHNC